MQCQDKVQLSAFEIKTDNKVQLSHSTNITNYLHHILLLAWAGQLELPFHYTIISSFFFNHTLVKGWGSPSKQTSYPAKINNSWESFSLFRSFTMTKRNSADWKIIPIDDFVSTYFPNTRYKALSLRGLHLVTIRQAVSKAYIVFPSVYSSKLAQLRAKIVTTT